MFGIIGIVLLVILVLYLIFNPAWIIKPKYMINNKYCEQDSDCVVSFDNCDAINKFNYREKFFGGSCAIDTCGAICEKNNCILARCIYND